MGRVELSEAKPEAVENTYDMARIGWAHALRGSEMRMGAVHEEVSIAALWMIGRHQSQTF
jgi:hypothetical protein